MLVTTPLNPTTHTRSQYHTQLVLKSHKDAAGKGEGKGKENEFFSFIIPVEPTYKKKTQKFLCH